MMLGGRGEFWFLGEFNAFLFSVSTRMNRHFPFCRYIIWVDKWHVSVFTIKNKVTEICTCGWRVILWGWLEKAIFTNVIWRLPDEIDLSVMLHKKNPTCSTIQDKKKSNGNHCRLITVFSLFWVQQSSSRRSWGLNVSSYTQVPGKDALWRLTDKVSKLHPCIHLQGQTW